MPIHHIVLFRMKSDLTQEQRDSFLPEAKAGLAKVPYGAEGSAVGPPIFDARAGGYDYGLYRQFTDIDEFHQYRAHADHMSLITGLVAERVAEMISFQIQG